MEESGYGRISSPSENFEFESSVDSGAEEEVEGHHEEGVDEY